MSKEVVHQKKRKRRRPVGYPLCVLKDGRVHNDDTPVRDHQGIWHLSCWEWHNEQERAKHLKNLRHAKYLMNSQYGKKARKS